MIEFKEKKIAHRGVFNNTTIPENSLSAFKEAISLHLAIELDVQLTKDEVVVVFHDSNLKRMTGLDKNIKEMTYQEIQEYPLLKTKEKIPTLQEVLQLVQEKVLLDIEVKDTKNIAKICNLVMKELKDYHNYVLQSFHPKIVRYLKKHYPTSTVGYIIHRNRYLFFFANQLLIHYTKADFLAIHKKLLPTKKFQKLKKKYPLFLWTIKKGDTISEEECVLICNDII